MVMPVEPTSHDSIDVPETADPTLLAQLLDPEFPARRVWLASELGAILQHLMTVPIPFDLSALPPGTSSRLQTLGAADGLLLNSLTALIHHPHPPVELLLLLKQYAKSNHQHPDSALPCEISSLLYTLSIAVARLRCRQRITTHEDAAVIRRIDAALALPWLDEQTRGLLQDARAVIRNQQGTEHGSSAGPTTTG